MSCNCSKDWRLEILDLQTGTRLGYLPFVSFDFEELLNQAGAASITIPIRKVKLRDVWPRLRAVAFTRVSGPGASTTSPKCEFIGMVENVSSSSDGTATIGLKSIEYYLNYRIFLEGFGDDSGAPQTLLGQQMLDYASNTDGLDMLTGDSDTSAFTSYVQYLPETDTVILDAITTLTETVDGPDYVRDYTFADGAWSAVIRFTDSAGSVHGTLDSNRGLGSYSLEVDGTEQANFLQGRGEEASFSTDDTATSQYPRFDAAMQVSDVGLYLQLTNIVQGWRRNHANPLMTPDVTVFRLALATAFVLGDTPDLNLNHGLIHYSGPARIIGKSWRVSPDEPTSCTFSFTPPDPSVAAAELLGAPNPPGVECCD